MSLPSPSPDLGQMGGQAFVEVLDTLLSFPATEVRGKVQPFLEGEGHEIWATVTLVGSKIGGEVRLELPKPFAERVADRLLGPPSVDARDESEVNDLSGELANMVAGRVAALLLREGFPCQLGIPVVIRGSRVRSIPEPNCDHSRTDWLCQGHWLTLDIHCRYRST